MQQISSKLNTYVQSISIVNNNIESKILHLIFWSFAVLALFYIFILGNMVKDIVARQALEVKVRALTNEVRNLEVTYLSLSNNVDLNLSHSLGFKEIEATFATHKTLGLLPDSNVKIAQNDI